ncbi:MAG: hypothetical protein JNL32_01345 [Candidatus Kapabacteria bacterium]|nr:hypothetical protein [Candidatus Kapabacteria bacterium]
MNSRTWLFRLILTQMMLLCAAAVALAQTDSLRTEDDDDDDSTMSGIAFTKRGMKFSTGGKATIKEFTLRFEYGSGGVRLNDATLSPGPLRFAEIHAGNESFSPLSKTKSVMRYTHDGLFGGVFGNDMLGVRRDSTTFGLSGWRWGYRSTSGFAYTNDEGTPRLGLLHTGGLVWTYLSTQSAADPTAQPQSATEYPRYAAFTNSVLGSHTGATVRYGFGGVGITLNYQRTLMFNNYSFWGWIGSGMIEGLSQTLLTQLIEKQLRTSPRTMPVANLLLRSALSFAFYQLRRNSQHFPFGGNTPLEFNQVTAGVNIAF